MKLRNTSHLAPLTPAVSTTTEFATAQQDQIAELTARLTTIERRYNGQQKRIAAQEAFAKAITTENAELRKRLRFLENASKLTTGPKQ